MKTVNYNYVYRGEQKQKAETVEKIYDRLLSMSETLSDYTLFPTVQFAQSCKYGYTGLVSISLNVSGLSGNDISAAIDILQQQSQVLLTYRDNYRELLVAVSAYTLPDGSLPQEDDALKLFHERAYFLESQYLKRATNLSLVSGGNDINHYVVLTPDRRAWMNMNVRPMVMPQPAKTLSETERRMLVESKLPDYYDTTFKKLPGYDELEMMMLNFQKCLSLTLDGTASGWKKVFAIDADSIDLFLTELAERCYANGVGEEFAIKRLLIFNRFHDKEVLVRKCFGNVYESQDVGRGFPSRTSSPKAISKSQVMMNMIIDYLPRRYRFRRNEMTGSLEYMEHGAYIFEWQPVTKYVINTITFEVQRLGIEAWDRDIKRYLESNFIDVYNPLTEYLHKVQSTWDGKDRIAELAARVPNSNPRWTELFHRWMLSAVSQWSGKNTDYGSTVVPLLIGAQGDGKSTFCRLLLPPELRSFYTDRLDFANKKDAERALSAFALINIDEFDSITKSQTAFLKHVLQKTNIMGRDPYAMAFTDHKRYAAFMATTNSPTPLIDPTGSRRYLCVRTTGKIDNVAPIEYDQVYAQLATELQQGERAYFNSEDEAYIQEQNSQYQVSDELREIFFQLFKLPHTEAEGELMTTSEIVRRMHQYSKAITENRSTYIRMGKLLSSLGVRVKHQKDGNFCRVVCKE